MNILFYLVPKSSVTFVYDDDSINEVLNVLEERRYTSVPVLSRDGSYVGSLSEGDILWGLRKQGSAATQMMDRMQVKHLHRNRDNQPVNINCSMEQLAYTAMKQNFIPVVDDDQIFIGIVTRQSVISYCLEERKKSAE